MKGKLYSLIAVIWGAALIFRWFTSDSIVTAGTSAAYQTGQNVGVLAGFPLFIIGIYFLFKTR